MAITPAVSKSVVLTFITAGTFTWVCPPDVTAVKVELIGAGGKGGQETTTGKGGGGGGGEYAAEPALSVTAGTSYTIVVAAAGSSTGVAPSSTFASTSVVAHGGTGPANNTATGGAGGTGSSNTTHNNGGTGGTSSTDGGGGGSGAGTAAVGNAGSGTTGAGGAATDVGGKGGNGKTGTQGIGTGGTAPGGGGGGALSTGTSEAGGAGAIGWARLTFTTAYYWDATNSGAALKTLAVSPTAIGDVMVLLAGAGGSATADATAVSGGGVTTWHELKAEFDGSGEGVDIWWGVVTTTGAATITVTASTWSGQNVLMAKQFTGGTAGTWTADTVTGGNTGLSGALTSFISTSPTTAGAELYLGVLSTITNSMTVGTTSGFFYQQVNAASSTNLTTAYHVGAPSPSAPAISGSSVSSGCEAIGFLIFTPSATTLPQPTTIVGQAVQRAAVR